MVEHVQQQLQEALGPVLAIELAPQVHEGRVDVVADDPIAQKPAGLGEPPVDVEDGAEQPEHVVAPRLADVLLRNAADDPGPLVVPLVLGEVGGEAKAHQRNFSSMPEESSS